MLYVSHYQRILCLDPEIGEVLFPECVFVLLYEVLVPRSEKMGLYLQLDRVRTCYKHYIVQWGMYSCQTVTFRADGYFVWVK